MYGCSSGPAGPAPPACPAEPPPGVDPQDHLALAAAVARRFRRPGVDEEDLVQAARLGLVRAARRYDPRLGVAFSTFAVPHMVGEVRRQVERSSGVSGSRTARQLVRRAESVRRRLEAASGRSPTLGEVAQQLGCDPAELGAAYGALAPPTPLEAPMVSPEFIPLAAPPASWQGAIPGHSDPLWQQAAVRLALARLPAELARLVYLRFFAGLTQQEAAALLGISQPTASRREREALGRLRRWLEDPESGPQRVRDLPEGLGSPAAKAP